MRKVYISNSKSHILFNKMSTSYTTNRKRKRSSDSNSSINDTSICNKDGRFTANFLERINDKS